jgi:hypothetical protein
MKMNFGFADKRLQVSLCSGTCTFSVLPCLSSQLRQFLLPSTLLMLGPWLLAGFFTRDMFVAAWVTAENPLQPSFIAFDPTTSSLSA